MIEGEERSISAPPLYVAIKQSSIRVILSLIEKGADINQPYTEEIQEKKTWHQFMLESSRNDIVPLEEPVQLSEIAQASKKQYDEAYSVKHDYAVKMNEQSILQMKHEKHPTVEEEWLKSCYVSQTEKGLDIKFFPKPAEED